MARQTTKGKCVFCQRIFSKAGMTRHLAACKERMPESGPVRYFHLVVEGLYRPQYWLHLELPANASLQNLDDFLRDIWVECCGHLSAFRIMGQTYTQLFDDGLFPDDKDMNVKVGQVLSPGLTFSYEYDFGTTTELKLKVAAERTGKRSREMVKILARNDPPDIRCQSCGRPATQVCTNCMYMGEGWLCDDCIFEHECGHELALPVVNSPRVGMCGYEAVQF